MASRRRYRVPEQPAIPLAVAIAFVGFGLEFGVSVILHYYAWSAFELFVPLLLVGLTAMVCGMLALYSRTVRAPAPR